MCNNFAHKNMESQYMHYSKQKKREKGTVDHRDDSFIYNRRRKHFPQRRGMNY